MHSNHLLLSHRSYRSYKRTNAGPRSSHWLLLMLGNLLVVCLVCMSACGNPSGDTPSPTPTAVRVNGFGTAANHSHSLLALPNHVLILASHYGIFRSSDGGASWTEVAAGPHQLMEGLMTYSLVSSPLDQQRLYVLTQPAVQNHQGTLGLYTSTDQGRTWQMTVKTASLTSGNIYFAQAGNETAQEVYIYLPDQGAQGLKVSKDGGQHFNATGNLPFGRILGLLALPGAPGELLAYGTDGLARSSDAGSHWQVIPNVTNGIFGAASAGPGKPVYVNGDSGLYTSNDGGKTFTQTNQDATYAALTVSPIEPQTLYGKTGRAVYRSTDGGHTWKVLPALKGNLENLAPDPQQASQLFLALSYPTATYHFDQQSNQWSSLTPPAEVGK